MSETYFLVAWGIGVVFEQTVSGPFDPADLAAGLYGTAHIPGAGTVLYGALSSVP